MLPTATATAAEATSSVALCDGASVSRWTAREDSAEAAAIILTSGELATGAFDGPVTLTASAAPTFDDIAALASGASGRAVTRVLVDPEQWIAANVAAGQPEFVARFMLGMYDAADQGFFAGVDPLLGELLGRDPVSVRDVLSRPVDTDQH